jgi:hypothetical protein
MSSAQDGTYDLHISFIGLCLSATTDKGTSLKVIMPECESHRVAIVFEGRYAGYIGTPYVAVPADDHHIDFSRLPSAHVFEPGVPPEILDVPTWLPSAKLLDPCDTQGMPAPHVNSLVTIRHGCAAGIGLPKTWYVEDTPERLTHCLEWCVSDIKDSSLIFSKFNGPDAVPPLTPVDSLSGPEIRLQIVCLPPDMIRQFPDQPAQLAGGSQAPDFHIFGRLFDGWDAKIIPVATPPGTVSVATLTAQDCISAGGGGG